VAVNGAYAKVVNNATLYGVAGAGIVSDHGVFRNNGDIYSDDGVSLTGDGLTATLGKDSLISSGHTGISIHNAAGEKLELVNDGVLLAKGMAFDCGAGDEAIINHGTIKGDVELGEGNEVFDNTDGKFTGRIYGGAGSDVLTGGKGAETFVFRTGDGKDHITDFGRGSDKIDLSDLSGVTDFHDMMNHHVTEVGGDLHINVGGDHLVLDDVAKADLHASEFTF
jgi:hypothetical protein